MLLKLRVALVVLFAVVGVVSFNNASAAAATPVAPDLCCSSNDDCLGLACVTSGGPDCSPERSGYCKQVPVVQ